MVSNKTVSRLTTVAVAGLLSIAGLAGQASAQSANISNWTSTSSCNVNSAYYFCLYYSPNHTGGAWRSTSNAVSNLSGKTFSGGAGDGQAVRNNAASAENGTYCNVGIWYSPGYTGDSNWLSGNRGGNLTSWLRNNEASIKVSDSAC